MTERSLQVTYRKGRAFAAYLHLPHPTGEKSARTVASPPWQSPQVRLITPLCMSSIPRWQSRQPALSSSASLRVIFHRGGFGFS